MSRRQLTGVIVECVAVGILLGLFLLFGVIAPVANGLGVPL